MISAGFTMDGKYLGKKEIYGDDTGLFKKFAYLIEKRKYIIQWYSKAKFKS